MPYASVSPSLQLVTKSVSLRRSRALQLLDADGSGGGCDRGRRAAAMGRRAAATGRRVGATARRTGLRALLPPGSPDIFRPIRRPAPRLARLRTVPPLHRPTPGPVMPPPPSRRRVPCAVLLCTVWLLAGCGEAPPALEVGGVGFSESDLLGLSEAQQDALVLVTVVGLAVSESRELELGAPVLEYRRALRMGDRLREEVVLAAAGVTEAELEERYLAAPDHELVVRHLVILSERWRPDEHRTEARARAAHALARAREGQDFRRLAAEVSEEPGAQRREGLLQPGREGTWVPEFWEAAAALEEGELSPVVETEYGFHVLRLEERRVLPFRQARDRVVGEVARLLGGGEAWEAWLDERRAGIRVDPEAVAAFDPRDPVEGLRLGSWPEGELDAGATAWRLRGLPRSEWNAFVDGDASQREARVRELTHLALLEEEARERDLQLRPTTEGELERDWERSVSEWGAFLGFRPGMTPSAIRSAALDGLRATGQNARIARGELEERAPALEIWVPVRHAQRD
jgi:hypothetical protein